MTHETIESISSYLDRELAETDRDRLEAHLATCPTCSSIKAGLERAAGAIAALPEVSPTPDESRKIRLAVVQSRRAFLPRISHTPQAWLAAGAVALLVAGVVGVALLRPGTPASELSQTAYESGPPIDLQSPEQTRDVVLANSEVKAGVGRFRVADVGAKQEEALALAPPEPTDARPGQAAEGASLTSCLRSVLQSQPYPMMPLVARPATYQGKPAWLLVYAWTSSSADEASLDRLQIWVVDRQQCFPLSYQALKP
jgi:hypothetical protein